VRKSLTIFVAVFFVLALVVGIVGEKAAFAEAEYVFKLGHSVNDQHPYQFGAERFKEIVEEGSNGQIKIELYPNNQLGTGERDLVKECSSELWTWL